MQKNNQRLLEEFRVSAKDRTFQIWERNSLSIDLYNEEVYLQKENYIHYNPVKAGLCSLPEEYHYSSARYYETLVLGIAMGGDCHGNREPG